MEESEAKLFLERNRSAVVNGVREVKRLVDFLMEKKYLLGEMPNVILTPKTQQDQVRELYRHLNTTKGFKLTLEWLRANEPDLVEDLEKNSDTDHAEPGRKRHRSSAEAVDHTDSDPNMPNLRCLSTLHKLEEWVSASKNSQNLIGMLNSKLAEGEMDTLEKQLMNKKLKKGLYFSAKDIKDIYSNQKLQSFYDACKDAKFPDLPLKLFFETDRGHATAMDDDDDDADVVTDSAYGSSFSASCSSNLSFFSKHSSQCEDQLQSDDLASTCESTDRRDALRNVKKTTDSKPQNTNVSPEEVLPKQPQIHHAAQGQSATHTQIQQTLNTQSVQDLLKIGPFTPEPFQPPTVNVAGDCLMQSEGPQMNHDPVPFAKVTDMPSQKGCRGFDISKQRQELPDAHCQNGSLVQMQHADKDGTPLEAMDTQEMLEEPNIQSAREMFTGKPSEPEPLLFTSLQVAADDPVPSEGPEGTQWKNGSYPTPLSDWTQLPSQKSFFPKQTKDLSVALRPDGDDTLLDKPLNLQKSEPNKQCDPEMANSERLVGNDCVGAVIDCVMQGGVQQMNCDPDPFTEFEGTDTASQKECRGFDLSKQRQELPDAYCQNGSLVQMQHADKDGTPLEAMDTQEMLEEPNIQSAREMFTGKPSEPEPLLFTSLQVAADDPVPSEGPEGTQWKNGSYPTPLSDWTQLPSQKSFFPKQTKDLSVALRPDGDDTLLDKPLNLQKSEPNKQCDPEMANSERLVGNDCVGAVIDCVMQGGVQQMNCDPDPFTEFEGTDTASQKECRGFDLSKQRQELPDAYCQNGSLVQMQHADKDGTPLEEAMETQEMLDEPNIQSNKEMLIGKPCAPEPLLSTSLQVAADDPVQSEDPEGPWEKSGSQTIPHSDKTNMPSQESVFPKQTKDLHDALRPGGDDAPLDKKNEANIQFNTKMANNKPHVLDPSCLGVATYSLMQSKGPHMDTKERSEADALIQNKDTEAPPQEQTVNVSHTLQGQDGNHTGLMCISDTVKNQTDGPSYRNSVNCSLEMPDQIIHQSSTSGDVQARFCSTPVNDSVKKAKRRQQQNKRKLNKINDKRRLLYEWAKKKCPKGSEEEVKEEVDEEVKKVFDCISIENHVQHSEYPCFNTENVMVYKDPQTEERQIIVTDEKNSTAKKIIPKEIKILLHYQMWVCGIAKAVLINQKEQELQFDLQFLEGIKNRCEKFVFEALAPALAVFKNLQRREKLYSLIKNH